MRLLLILQAAHVTVAQASMTLESRENCWVIVNIIDLPMSSSDWPIDALRFQPITINVAPIATVSRAIPDARTLEAVWLRAFTESSGCEQRAKGEVR